MKKGRNEGRDEKEGDGMKEERKQKSLSGYLLASPSPSFLFFLAVEKPVLL